MEKVQIEKLLELVLENVESTYENIKPLLGKDIGYRSIDEYLMREAYKHVELHSLMKEIVKEITEHNVSGSVLWEHDQEHMGTNAALLLALGDKESIEPYAYFIATNDLNHPVYQEEDWDKIFSKWGYCEETLLLLMVIELTPGQYFQAVEYWEEFIPYLQENGVDIFFKQLYHMLQNYPSKEILRYILNGNCQDYLEEKLPDILPDESEESIEALIKRFMAYEGTEAPTLAVLKGVDLGAILEEAIWEAMEEHEEEGDVTIAADFNKGILIFTNESDYEEEDAFYTHKAEGAMAAFLKNEDDPEDRLKEIFEEQIGGNTAAFMEIEGSVHGAALIGDEVFEWEDIFSTEDLEDEDSGFFGGEEMAFTLLDEYVKHTDYGKKKEMFPVYEKAKDIISDIYENKGRFPQVYVDKTGDTLSAVFSSNRCTYTFHINRSSVILLKEDDMVTKSIPEGFREYLYAFMGWEKSTLELPDDVEKKSGENQELVYYILEKVKEERLDDKGKKFLDHLFADKDSYTYNTVTLAGSEVLLNIAKEDKSKKSNWDSYAVYTGGDMLTFFKEARIISSFEMSEDFRRFKNAILDNLT